MYELLKDPEVSILTEILMNSYSNLISRMMLLTSWQLQSFGRIRQLRMRKSVNMSVHSCHRLLDPLLTANNVPQVEKFAIQTRDALKSGILK
jgi:hypothetical protein